MDSEFENQLDKQMEEEVLGLLVIDKNGLCVSRRGIAESKDSGYFKSISEKVKKIKYLTETNKEINELDDDVSFSIKFDKFIVWLSNCDDFLLAIYKNIN